jgi:hypothetical protein
MTRYETEIHLVFYDDDLEMLFDDYGLMVEALEESERPAVPEYKIPAERSDDESVIVVDDVTQPDKLAIPTGVTLTGIGAGETPSAELTYENADLADEVERLRVKFEWTGHRREHAATAIDHVPRHHHGAVVHCQGDEDGDI